EPPALCLLFIVLRRPSSGGGKPRRSRKTAPPRPSIERARMISPVITRIASVRLLVRRRLFNRRPPAADVDDRIFHRRRLRIRRRLLLIPGRGRDGIDTLRGELERLSGLPVQIHGARRNRVRTCRTADRRIL